MHSERYFKPSTEAFVPDQETQQRILYDMEHAYKESRWNLPDDFLSYENFVKAVHALDMTSSPGIPYMREATSNGDWLRWNGFECDQFQLNRLWYDVQNVLEGKSGALLIRSFIKQEPHKNSKAREGRWRLIMASPLCEQVAWAMLFRFHNDREIAKSYFIPSQHGIKLVGGGWKRYRSQWQTLGLEYGLDKSAWDWTMPYWCILLDLEFRRRMGRGQQLEQWYRIATMLYERMFTTPILVTSDGNMWRQKVPGIMKSGCYNTISTNGHGQSMIHCCVCYDLMVEVLPFCRSCGDDTLSASKHVQDIAAYTKYGVIIKTASEALEFVGHEFTASGPHPLYMAKHIKKLHYVAEDILPQYLDSMARMYVHTRYYYFWERMAYECGYPLPLSREAYLYWYDVCE